MPSDGEVAAPLDGLHGIAGEGGEGARAAEQVARDGGIAPSSAPVPSIYPNLHLAEVGNLDSDPDFLSRIRRIRVFLYCLGFDLLII